MNITDETTNESAELVIDAITAGINYGQNEKQKESDDYIDNGSKEIISMGVDIMSEMQEQIISGGGVEYVHAAGNFLNSLANMMNVINNTSKRKNDVDEKIKIETVKHNLKMKEIEFAQSQKLKGNNGNNNNTLIIATRDEIVDKLLSKRQKREAIEMECETQ